MQKEIRFTGYEHAPTGRRFKKFENAKTFAVKWGRTAGSGPNDVHAIEKDCRVRTISFPWK